MRALSPTHAARTGFLRIEILLGAMPRMLHEVVSGILTAESDLHIVAEGVGESALLERVDRDRPDVVVLAVPSGPPPRVCGELLRRYPTLTVLALEDRGQLGSFYLLRPMRFRLTDVSGRQMVSGIRSAVASRDTDSHAYYADAGWVDMVRPRE
jgi:DNA-binding NarL/FixJ family response regulator